MQRAQERLYLTADKGRLVGHGDKAAAFLYATPGDEIPDDAAARFGLVHGRLPLRRAQDASKGKPASEDKEKPGGGDKGGAGQGDDLTKVKGIGAATAKKLVAAGLDSFATLAAFTPDDPRFMALGVKRADLENWIEEAKGLTAPTGAEE